MPGIIAYGGYVPRLRLQRKSMVEANAWFNPGLAAYAKGERAFAREARDPYSAAKLRSRGVWVPAFAGTTASLLTIVPAVTNP